MNKVMLFDRVCRVVAYCALAAGLGLLAVELVRQAKPLDASQLQPGFAGGVRGFDFMMRVNECNCLCERVDPMDVWTGKVSHPLYYPFDDPSARTQEKCEPVNGYTPWAYVFVYPFTCVSRDIAWGVFYGLMALGIVGWLVTAFWLGRRVRNSLADGLFVLAAVVLAAPMFLIGVMAGNYAPIIGGAAALLLVGFERGRSWDVVVAMALTVMMMKPQMSVLLVIPLLISGRVRPVVTSAAICLAALGVVAVMCGKSPVELTLAIPSLAAPVFSGCGLLPGYVYAGVDSVLGLGKALFVFPAVAGLVICCWLTWKCRGGDVLGLFAPAVLCSVCWSYARPHQLCLSWIPLAFLAVSFIRSQTIVRKAFCVMAMICASRVYYIPLRGLNMLGVVDDRVLYGVILPPLTQTTDLLALICLAVVIAGEIRKTDA